MSIDFIYKKETDFQPTSYFFTQKDAEPDPEQKKITSFLITNEVFENIDFYSNISLDRLTIKLLNSIGSEPHVQLFSKDFDLPKFCDYVMNSLLSFDEKIVLSSSRLLLTLTYLSKKVSNYLVSYLSTKIGEMICVFREFYQNLYILNLFQSVFVEFPDSACAALEMGILDIFSNFLKSPSIEKKQIRIAASIIQFLTIQIDHFSREKFDMCFDITQNFLKINDEKIYSSALYTISHLQKKMDFPPDAIFHDDSLNILIDQLSRHKNIIPILQVLSNIHDVTFINVLFDNGFPLIIEDIVRKENEPICIQILDYLFDQINENNELSTHFSFMVLVFADEFDDLSFSVKTSFVRFFSLCFKYNFDFLYQQNCFEFIFCSIFDLLESILEDDLIEVLLILNFYVNRRQEVSDFISQHQDCSQAIYNLCSHEDIKIAQEAQNIISIIKDQE